MRVLVLRLAQSTFVHSAVGFLLMASWAFYANRNYPMPAPVIAGLLQGFLTAGVTVILKHMTEAQIRKFGGLSGLILPPLCAGSVSASILGSVHWLAGTPEVLATLAIPVTGATCYAALMSITIWSQRRRSGLG